MKSTALTGKTCNFSWMQQHCINFWKRDYLHFQLLKTHFPIMPATLFGRNAFSLFIAGFDAPHRQCPGRDEDFT
jgi:hypothetical protein